MLSKYKMECCYCKKIFSNKSTLSTHQKTTKYCLKIQNTDTELKNFKCNYCNKILTTKQHLLTHLSTCKEKEIQERLKEEFDKKENLYKKQIEKQENLQKKELQKQYKLHQEQLEKQEKFYKEQLEKQEKFYKEQLKKQEDQNNDLLLKLEKIANKAIDRPTTTNHNNTINNKIELNTFPSQLEIDRKIESQFNDKYLWDGMKGVAQFVYDHIIKLEDGSIAYACFDTSRQVFKYKDEKGVEIKDPKALKLKKMIKPGLLKQSQTLYEYFNDECDFLENRKNKGLDIDGKEYSTMNTLRDKAFEVGCEILNLEDTNKFSNELASITCI